MTGRILRPPGGRYSILDIAQEDRDKIAEVGTLAKKILSTQNQEAWAQAGDPHLLQRALAGAIVLERIGEQMGAVLVEDDGAHLAFMACCSLTLFAKDLDRSSLRSLGETLKTMSMACPVKTTIHDLPPFSCLPAELQTTTLVQRQYQLVAEASPKPIEFTLADALALYRIFLAAKSRQFSAALAEVTKTSEGLRIALRQLKLAEKD